MSGPVVVVAPPGSGTAIVAAALAASPSLTRVAEPDGSFLDALDGLGLADHPEQGHRLDATDAAGRGEAVRAALAPYGRALLSGPRYALRVAFLAAAVPDARFVLVQADAGRALARATGRWHARRPRHAIELPGWTGPPWTLPVVPGWRALDGLPLEQVAARQWRTIAETLLDDLEALPPERWAVVDRPRLLASPDTELARLAGFLDVELAGEMVACVEDARRADAVSHVRPAAGRIDELVAAPAPDGTPAPGSHALRFTEALDRLGGAIAVVDATTSTLTCLQRSGGRVVSATYDVPGVTALAADATRLVLAVGGELWVLAREGDGYVLRTKHLTGRATIDEVRLDAGVVHVLADGLAARWDDARGLVGVAEMPGAAPHDVAVAGTTLSTPWGSARLTGAVREVSAIAVLPGVREPTFRWTSPTSGASAARR